MPRLLSGKVRRAQSPLEIYLHEIKDKIARGFAGMRRGLQDLIAEGTLA